MTTRVDDPGTMITRWSYLLVLCLLGTGCQNTKPMFRARAQIYVRPPVYYAPRVVQQNPPGAVWTPAPAAPVPYSGVLVRRAPVAPYPQPYLAQQQPHPAPVTYAAAGANPALSAESIASRAAHSRDPFEALSENSQMSDALDRIANEYRRLAGAKVREGIGFRTIPQAENYVRVTRRNRASTFPSSSRERSPPFKTLFQPGLVTTATGSRFKPRPATLAGYLCAHGTRSRLRNSCAAPHRPLFLPKLPQRTPTRSRALALPESYFWASCYTP
jgi:hypothetical protein